MLKMTLVSAWCSVFEDFVRTSDTAYCWDLRDVNYDEGYQFDFLNEVNRRYSIEFDRILFMEGMSKFARFYKRGHYSWENETRLAFDYGKSSPYSGFLKAKFGIESTPDGRTCTTLPLKGDSETNPWFTLDVVEVILGYHVSAYDGLEIKALIAKKFPSARVWQREHYNY